MTSLFLVDNLDFSRSFGEVPEVATIDSVADFLRTEWIGKKGGRFNYATSMSILADAFSGMLTREQAISLCKAYWHPRGRIENEQVVSSFWDYVSKNRCTVYRRKFLAAPIGKWKGQIIYLGVKVPLIRVVDGVVLATMPVFRKNFVPGQRPIDLALTGVREFCLREGYPDIEPEFIRAAGISGVIERQLVVEKAGERNLYSSDAFDHFANIFVGAVAKLADSGVGLSKPSFRGYRVMDPDQPGMF